MLNKYFRLIVILVCLTFIAAVSGCAAPDNSSGKPAASTEKKQQGGIIRIAIGSEPDSLDPWLSAASDTQAIMDNVFEGLLGFNEEGQLIPALAEKYEISSDGLKYTFTLRKGVKFHNGSPMTAADVKYSYDKFAGQGGEKATAAKFSKLLKIEIPDESTIIFTLKGKDSSFLAACVTPVLPRNYSDQGNHPVGTGPFKFVEYVPGQKVVLEKNNDYYDPKRTATVDKVEFRIMTDASAVLMALKAGELDMAEIRAEDAPVLKNDFTILEAPQNMVQLLALNNTRKPFDNLKVRQALNYAIDKDAIINAVAGGYGTKLASNMSPIMSEYFQDGLDMYPTDIAKAKQLLKEAGYENGFSTTVTVPANYKFHVDTAQVIADQLAKIGVKLTIKQVEWGQWLEQVWNNADYDSTIIGLTGKLDPHEVLVRYDSSYPRNFYHFSNVRYDSLINEASTETNEATRVNLYKECQKILAEQAVAVYIMDPSLIVACKKNLKGFKFYPVRFFDISSMYYTE